MANGARPSTFALTGNGRVKMYSLRELLELPPPRWHIDTVIPEGGLSAIYGPPGSLKSFIAVDMAMSVSAGVPWLGHAVRPGMVLYVSAEGGGGIGKRAAAWLQVRNMKPRDANINWIIEPVHLYEESESINKLVERIENEVYEVPRLIVIDTLARCFVGDENGQEDMNSFVAGADRLRREFNATVLILHHSRLDGTRERGNTAFRGALDGMYAIKRYEDANLIRMSNEKTKDFEECPDIEMRTVSVVLHKKDTDGREVTSLVMESVAATPDAEDYTTVESRVIRCERLLGIMGEIGPQSFTNLRDSAIANGMTLTTFNRARRDLIDDGLISNAGKVYRVLSLERPVSPPETEFNLL